jgi:hypothetical protein
LKLKLAVAVKAGCTVSCKAGETLALKPVAPE